MASPKILLEVRGISVQFDRKRVLQDINLQVREGEIVSIIGPNGAGKSTLFNVITGLVPPQSGKILFFGRDITGSPPHRICRSGIARTFQIARPFPEMTSEENVFIGLWFGREEGRFLNENAARQQARRFLQMVGLGHKASTPGKELTLSEQRRLEVARALATDPVLLLLDEIAAGLSPQAVAEAARLVRTLSRHGITILMVDHFLNLTARVSHRLLALDQGEVIAEGPPQKVLHHPEVLSAYLGERRSRISLEEDW